MRGAAAGEPSAADELLPLVYEQLLAIARHRMQHERPGHTLQATALVHEAYLRLVGDGEGDVGWSSRTCFFQAAALAMRRILVEHARRRGRIKRGSAARHVPLDALDLAASNDTQGLLELDEAVTRLSQRDPRAADIVSLRFYAGLSVEETAQALGLSERTVKREWSFARAWLFQEIEKAREP